MIPPDPEYLDRFLLNDLWVSRYTERQVRQPTNPPNMSFNSMSSSASRQSLDYLSPNNLSSRRSVDSHQSLQSSSSSTSRNSFSSQISADSRNSSESSDHVSSDNAPTTLGASENATPSKTPKTKRSRKRDTVPFHVHLHTLFSEASDRTP